MDNRAAAFENIFASIDDDLEKLHFEVAQSLASDYESIYYINLETGSYGIYNAKGQFTMLDMPVEGNDFFTDAQRDVVRVVYEPDQQAMSIAMLRKTLEGETKNGQSFRHDYRLVIEGEPVFYSMKATRSLHDEKHLIIGVTNIDRQKKREMEFELQLRQALDRAMRDELTGVRNRNAYIQAEADLNKQIEAGELKEFGLVICDLNYLKDANDQLGHAVGDQLIRNACHTVCSIFDHSPVFRIGGDEFICILRNHDYDYRDELFAQLGASSAAAAEANKKADVLVDPARPVIACGMDVFNPVTDEDVNAVFERADAAMYESKERLKS